MPLSRDSPSRPLFQLGQSLFSERHCKGEASLGEWYMLSIPANMMYCVKKWFIAGWFLDLGHKQPHESPLAMDLFSLKIAVTWLSMLFVLLWISIFCLAALPQFHLATSLCWSSQTCFYSMFYYYVYYRRNIRRQISDNMDRWKAEESQKTKWEQRES